MTISMKPLGSRVVIEPIEQEEITAGGIVLFDGFNNHTEELF